MLSEITLLLIKRNCREIVEKKWKEGRIENKDVLLEGLQKEYIFFLFYVLKNELRRPWRGCVTRIKRIVMEAREESKIHEVDIEVNNKANKLLYFIVRKPNIFSVTLGKTAIEIFDRM